MPSLFFPNPDAVRLALASGVIPAEVARQPVVAGTDAAGGVWVSPTAAFPRDRLAPLARLNVRQLTQPPELPVDQVPCWAALIPLRPDPQPPAAGALLFDVPATQLARFVAAVRRLHPQPVRFLIRDDRAFLRVENPPHYLTLTAADTGAGAYRQQTRGVWVRLGHEHPLAGPVGFDPHRVMLVDPPTRWRVLPEEPFLGTVESTKLTTVVPVPDSPSVRASIRVPLKLRKQSKADAVESLWVLRGEPTALTAFVADADEKLIRKLEVAILSDAAGGGRIVLRPVGGKRLAHVLPPDVSAFTAHPARGDVFLPIGFVLSPNPRADALGRALDLADGQIAWVESDGIHRVPTTAFRPLAELLTYQPPTPVTLTPSVWSSPFPLPGFVVESLTTSRNDHETLLPPHSAPPLSEREESGSWFRRVAGLFRSGAPQVKKRSRSAKKPDDSEPVPTPPPKVSRTPNEWTVRRAELERQVLEAGHRLDPRSRADLWAELARLYAETGQPADAGICWANAVWDRLPPPADWLDQWVTAEARACRLAEAPTFDAILARPASVAVARVAAAAVVRAGFLPQPPSGRWPEMLRLLDKYEQDLPVRAAWLARWSAAAVASGDPLALARCRDRLFARLAHGGPALDLDAPSFLRFHGTAGGDRFSAAREWLHRARDPVQRWLGKLNAGGALARFGLEADLTATAAYADLMFAWGMMKLGDRTSAKELALAAEARLSLAPATGVNPAVHRRLCDRFRSVLRSAEHGRPDAESPSGPFDDDLSEYTVANLVAHSRILDPTGGASAFLGRDLVGLVGGDPFGERLVQLLGSTNELSSSFRDLLSEAFASGEADRLPRAALIGLTIAPRLAPDAAAELLARVPAAMGWVAKLSLVAAESKRWEFEVVQHGRLLSGAVAAAVRFHLPHALRPLLKYLNACLSGMESAVRDGLARCAGTFFRGLRKLGLTADCEAILTKISDRAYGWPASVTDRLRFAVGWAAVGREPLAVRAVDDARDRLFVAGIPDERERTSVAIAYAAALGHVQPRLALGRLEELFQRLDRVTTTGASARYFAVKPLALVDTAVTAVVTDDFALGPKVRGWLDDDEFQLRKRIARHLAAAVAEDATGGETGE